MVKIVLSGKERASFRKLRNYAAGLAAVGALVYGIISLERPKEPYTSALRSYYAKQDTNYKEFKGSKKTVPKQIDVPQELAGFAIQGDYSSAEAIDINGDGIEEVAISTGCGSGGCTASLYEKTGSGYKKILGDFPDRIHIAESNYPDVFVLKKFYFPMGGSGGLIRKYTWDREKYTMDSEFLDPENMKYVADRIQEDFSVQRNRNVIKQNLNVLSSVIGPKNVLDALFIGQRGPGVPFPTGDELTEYTKALSKEEGVDFTRYNNPDELERVLFNNTTNMIVASSDPRIAFGMALARGIAKETRTDPYSKHVDRWSKTNTVTGNTIVQFRKMTGRDPNSQELYEMQVLGPSYAIREDKIPSPKRPSESVIQRYETPNSSIETMRTPIGATPQQVQEMQYRSDMERRQQESRQKMGQDYQNLQRRADTEMHQLPGQVQQGVEKARQGADQVRSFLDNLGKKKDK